MDVYEKALKKHEEWQGKVATEVKAKVLNAEENDDFCTEKR